jgi:hypothetical protein
VVDGSSKRINGRMRLLLLGACALLGGAAAADTARISVDAQSDAGAFRAIAGTAGVPGPAPGFPQFPDVTRQWKDAHVQLVRSYDWVAHLDTVDAPDSLFPKWSADPADPASYNFAAADAWVKATKASGAEVLFTFMSTIPRNKLPAADLAKYETVVEHIVRHYAKAGVRHFEFGDQPDLAKLHFDGTPEQFYDMYGAVARAVKRVDPTLVVGGPSVAFGLNEGSPFREGFLDAVKRRNLPLDFYSFIWFSDVTRDPMDPKVVGTTLRQLLDARGFKQTQLFLTSWNYAGIPTTQVMPVDAAAYQAAASIYMLDSPLDRSFLFRGDTGIDPHYGFTDPAHIYEADGSAGVRGAAFAYAGKTMTGRRLVARGGDDSGFAVAAGRDDKERVVRVLIANHAVPDRYLARPPSGEHTFRIPLGPQKIDLSFRLPPARPAAKPQGKDGFDLTVTGLPWQARRYTVSRYRIDAAAKGELVSTETISGTAAHIRAAFPAPAVELVEIRPLAEPVK